MLIVSLSVCLFVCLCVIMSTRGWKQSRRRRTFPVTRSPGRKQGTLCSLYPKNTFFREIRSLNGRNFSGMWNHVSRATTWTRVRGKFGENRSKESSRSGASYTSQKTTPLRPIFSRSLRNWLRDFAVNVQGLVFSGLNPACQVSSKSIQVSESY